MSAGILLGCATGMEDGGSVAWEEAGYFQFLECTGGDGWDLGRMLNRLRRELERGTDITVRSVVFELEGEQFKGERREIGGQKPEIRNLFAQARGEAG